MDSESGDAIRAEAEKALMDLVFDTVFNEGAAAEPVLSKDFMDEIDRIIRERPYRETD